MEGIWLYTLDRSSLAQADSYYEDLVAVFEALESGVKRGCMVDLRSGYRKHARGAHMIYFRQEDDRVDITRILHARQEMERHLSR